jgi:quinohemoprotein ethanol dehydrogenase
VRSGLLVFKLGGTAALPLLAPSTPLVLDPPPEPTDTASVGRGELLFGKYCGVCHGHGAVSGGVVPDLRASSFLSNDVFYNVVLDGVLKDAGMASFKAALSRDDVTAIRDYIIHRANEDKTEKPASPSSQ